MKTRQEVVSAGEERLRVRIPLYIWAQVRVKSSPRPFNAIARNLGAQRNLKHRNLRNAQAWFSDKAQHASAHSTEWIYSGVSKTSILWRTPLHRNN